MHLEAPSTAASAEETGLVAAAGAGDEQAFATLVQRHFRPMLVLATAFVLAGAAADQLVGAAWMAALTTGDRYDASTSVRAWLFRSVARCAAPPPPDAATAGPMAPAVDPGSFRGADDAFPGHWRAYPRDWREVPGDVLHSSATTRTVAAALAALPLEQRVIVTLRDVLGCTTAEASAVLEVPETTARAHLHRGRAQIRAALERHLDG
jgi:RNA polymerase sigma-70 factor, ECF subfamily